MRKRELKNVEWGLLIATIILCIVGLIALFSATIEAENGEFKKQIVWLIISLVIMLVVTMIDYEVLVKFSPIFYRCIYIVINCSSIY